MAKIIAIVLVMVVINAFLVYAVIKAWQRTNDKVNKYFLDRSSDFYVDKERNINTTKNKQEEKTIITNQKPVYVVDSKVDSSAYKDKDFNSKYKTVKEHLYIDKDKIIQDVINENHEFDISIESIALKMDEEFTFDTIYQLSTLSSEQQIEILNSSFDLTEVQLLDQYREKHPEKFSAINFFSYVKTIAKSNDPKFYIETGTRRENFDDIDRRVKTVYNKDITEGIKIVYKDKLYDYSI